jgi:hypothetical protein
MMTRLGSPGLRSSGAGAAPARAPAKAPGEAALRLTWGGGRIVGLPPTKELA